MFIHSSILLSFSMICMAKAAFTMTQLFCAGVAVPCNTLSNMRAASAGVLPPFKSASLQRVKPKSSGKYIFSFAEDATLNLSVRDISSYPSRLWTMANRV